MDPVIGLDVAKEESQVQAFLRRKTPYNKSFKFKHTVEVVLESTGHYHEPVVQFLERKEIIYFLVNPIVSHGSKIQG